MANGDFEMRPAEPARVERLIEDSNPLQDYFAGLPGFHTEIKVTEKKDEARFIAIQQLIAATEILKTRYTQYDYDIEEVTSRTADRKTINKKIANEVSTHEEKMKAEEKKHKATLFKLKRYKQLLDQLEQIDDNLLIINAEIEETAKHLNAREYKEAQKEWREAAKHARNARLVDNAMRQEERRRKEPARRQSPPPPLIDEPVEQQANEQVAEEYARTAASA